MAWKNLEKIHIFMFSVFVALRFCSFKGHPGGYSLLAIWMFTAMLQNMARVLTFTLQLCRDHPSCRKGRSIKMTFENAQSQCHTKGSGRRENAYLMQLFLNPKDSKNF